MDDAFELRSVPFELRSTGDGLTLSGYAAVFNSPTLIWERGREFNEVIAPGAFAKSVNAAARDRIVMQFDHGQHPMIGSMPLGKITKMREDERGLYVEARLSDNWLIQPVRDAIRDGAITGMSFRFSVPDGGDTWDRSGDTPTRTVREVKLYEVGPVVHPAYTDTSVLVRSAVEKFADRAISDPEENAQALALVAQMSDLCKQLVALEGSALAAGDDCTDELYSCLSILSCLSCIADSETEDTAEMAMGMETNSAGTPDEGHRNQPDDPATPDEGQRFRTKSQRQALVRLRLAS